MKFKTIRDLISFTKLALYMTEKKASQKLLKWKKNGELEGDADMGYILKLRNECKEDEEFINNILYKYSIWKHTNKQSVVRPLP